MIVGSPTGTWQFREDDPEGGEPLGRQILKVLAILLSGPVMLVLVLGGAVVLVGLLEGPTICQLIIENRSSKALEHGTIVLNRRPGPKRERILPTLPSHTRATFELDHFYTEPGGDIIFERANDSEVRGVFDYIDSGETWRYRMIVTDDTTIFSGEPIKRSELKSRDD